MNYLIQKIFFIIVIFWTQFSAAQEINKNESLDSMLKNVKNPKKNVDLLINLSEKYEYNNADTALFFARSAFAKAKEIDYANGKIKSLQSLGNILLIKNDYINALKYAEEALAESEKADNLELIGSSKINIALIYSNVANMTLATKYNFESLKIFEKLNNFYQIGIIYGNIGANYFTQGKYNKALVYMDKSLKIAESTKDSIGIAYQLNNIGIIYLIHYKDKEKSISYFKKALSINKEIDNRFTQGSNYINIGIVFKDFENYDSAFFYTNSALEIFTSMDSKEQISSCYHSLGEIYYKTKNFNKAIFCAERAIDIAQKYRYLEATELSSGLLHKSYLALNDTIKAYRYFAVNKNINDSLSKMHNQQEIAKIEFQYFKDKENQQKRMLQKRRSFFIILIIALLIISILFIILLFLRQKVKIKTILVKNQNIKIDIDSKNKELTVNLLALSKNKDFLDKISGNLQNVYNIIEEKEVKKSLNEIINNLETHSESKILTELTLRFNEANKDFYYKLTERFPQLTQNDLKLAGFLRLNMTSKDISLITGQRLETIEMSRYRLRKKLGLNNTDANLIAFLTQI